MAITGSATLYITLRVLRWTINMDVPLYVTIWACSLVLKVVTTYTTLFSSIQYRICAIFHVVFQVIACLTKQQVTCDLLGSV